MKKRFVELDSLRGLASLCVVFLHMYLILPIDGFTKIIFEYSPLRLIISGGEAVILFFVLSGFVLSLPFYSSSVDYLSFIVKRICRIYLPYWVALIMALLMSNYTGLTKVNELSGWFNQYWRSTDIPLKDHILLINTFMSNLNPVLWSLLHEMRISIVFPLLMVIILKVSWKRSLLIGVLLSCISVIIFAFTKYGNQGVELTNTLNYVLMFIVGALLAKHSSVLVDYLKMKSRHQKILLFVIGLALYLFAKPSFIIKLFLFPDIAPFYRTIMDSWMVTLGSVIIILLTLSSVSFSKFLKNNVIHYLGKISYSLYLTHIIVLFSFTHILFGKVSMLFIFSLSLLVSLIVSTLMYRFLEEPSIIMGRYLSNKLRTTKVKENTDRAA